VAVGINVWVLFSVAVHTNFHAELRRVMKNKTAVHFEEFYAPSQTWLEANAYPTRFGLAVFARDITQRKRFEEQLRQTQKLESLGVLAGGVAHDFNNLLVGILGNASLALESISPASPVREMLQDVVKATEQAAHLTKQLLAYAGKGVSSFRPLIFPRWSRRLSAFCKRRFPDPYNSASTWPGTCRALRPMPRRCSSC
jgi:signal transduction histidine kinase